MEKITEHTDGAHAYMKLRLNDGSAEEIDAYFLANGTRYRITRDGDGDRRQEIISAFQSLY